MHANCLWCTDRWHSPNRKSASNNATTNWTSSNGLRLPWTYVVVARTLRRDYSLHRRTGKIYGKKKENFGDQSLPSVWIKSSVFTCRQDTTEHSSIWHIWHGTIANIERIAAFASTICHFCRNSNKSVVRSVDVGRPTSAHSTVWRNETSIQIQIAPNRSITYIIRQLISGRIS